MKNDKTKNDRRSGILHGALKTFCKKGYDGTTVDDIVKSAGCSHGLFYHYFSSKKEVFNEIIKYRMDNYFNQLVSAVEGKETSREKLRAITDSMFYELRNDENYSYFFYFLVSSSIALKGKRPPPPPKDENGNVKPHPIQLLSNIFAEGQARGEFTTKYSPLACARLFNAIIRGATLGYVIAPKDVQKNIELPETDFILDIFRKGDTQ